MKWVELVNDTADCTAADGVPWRQVAGILRDGLTVLGYGMHEGRITAVEVLQLCERLRRAHARTTAPLFAPQKGTGTTTVREHLP